MGMRARVFPTHSGMLWRRWEPGAGYQGYPGITGLADCGDGSDPEYDLICAAGSTGEETTPAEIPFGSKEDCADLSLWASVEARNAACFPTVETGMPGSGPADELTPEELLKEQTAAQAWILKNVPNAAAAAAGALTLTAAQIAAGLAVGTVQKNSSCASGYRFATGVCVPPAAAASSGGGQWVSFATNKQLLTWGGVVVAALVIINLIPTGGGGGRRRR